MKQIHIAAIVVCGLSWTACGRATQFPGPHSGAAVGGCGFWGALKSTAGDAQVEGEGAVTRVLADDLAGGRHQRFIVRLASGQTVLIAHNIDIAPRVTGLKKGDSVRFCGEYVWNEKGGVVHWTHHDPRGRHTAGWLKHNGRTYQ